MSGVLQRAAADTPLKPWTIMRIAEGVAGTDGIPRPGVPGLRTRSTCLPT